MFVSAVNLDTRLPCSGFTSAKQITITRQLNQRVLTSGWLGGNPRKFHELHDSVRWVYSE